VPEGNATVAGVDWATGVHAGVLAAGAGLVALLLAVVFVPVVRGWWLHWRDGAAGPAARAILTIAPWLALFALVLTKGLWWTQRPPALRLVVVLALTCWSLMWCLPIGPSPAAKTAARVRSITLLLAAAFWALGFEGLAFGLTPFGCGASALLALAAFGALALAEEGRHAARLNFIAVSVATLLTVVVLEAAVRVLHVGVNLQESDSRAYARQFFAITPPGAAFLNRPKALDEFPPALIEINSLGIRGPEIPGARADVLLIGDSFVEARQLPWDRTITPRLQEALKQRSLSDRVAGHGMRGWSPLLEWNWYLKVGRTLHPRVVLLCFFWNDLWPSGDEVTTFRAVTRSDGRPEHFDVLVEPDWIWYQHVRTLRLAGAAWHDLTLAGLKRSLASMSAAAGSALDEAAAERLARSSVSDPPLSSAELEAMLTRPVSDLDPGLRALAGTAFWPGIRPLAVWTDAQRRAAAAAERELQRFAEDVAGDGGRLVIVYVPNPMQIGPGECPVGRFFDRVDAGVLLPPDSGVQAWLRTITDRHGIGFLDPSGAMRAADQAAPGSAPLYLRADCHWSAAGHQFMADFLADWYARSRAPGQ
jgi:hypothetical protein